MKYSKVVTNFSKVKLQPIHQNPVRAKLCHLPEEWEYSSYKDVIKNDSGIVKVDELLFYFADVNEFVRSHVSPIHFFKTN